MLERAPPLSTRFELLRQLGAGSHAQVWLAQDLDDRRQIALKLMKIHPRGDRVIDLEREFELLRDVQHPHVIRAFGVHRGVHQDELHVALAMEYASCGDVSRLRAGPMRDVLQIVASIAGALGFLHRRGLVHRDVKSSNILVMSDRTARLSDLGIASALGTLHPAVGSKYSMSPQQRAGLPAAIADDIFGFGALLYELLCGYPPFYPHADPQQSRAIEPLPNSVPARLRTLVLQMLMHEPSERPRNMDTVERELKAAATEPMGAPVDAARTAKIEPPSLHAVQGEPLKAEWRKSNQPPVDPSALQRQGFRRGLGAAAIAVGVLAVAIVFVVLPKLVDRGSESASAPTTQASTPSAAAVTPPVPEKKEVDFAELARAKQHVEEMRAALDERLTKLRNEAADRWGNDTLPSALREWEDADRNIESREYPEAEAHLTVVQKDIETLEQRAPVVLAEQLTRGDAALADGNSADAKSAYELAKQIDPKNARVLHGLKRAATLDQVLALLITAERAEKDGNLNAAMGEFRQALALDNETARASDGVSRIQAHLANDAFASAMARGYSALAAKNYDEARSAFEAARKIRPSAAEVDQGIKQIEQEQRTRSIEAKLVQAVQEESQEHWGAALKIYREAHDLDTTVAAANEGIARTEPRAALHEQLQLYLTQPERMFTQPVRMAAKDTLAQASRIENPGPILQQQIAQLRDWLVRADAPVAVALESDNLTQVTIYRVGQLGTFTQRQLQLTPGRYTVVGTRPGYRDVRREIAVMPMAALEPIVIRCEDRI